MDFFGIEAAIRGVVRVYFQSARATGRTTRLVNSLKPGDQVIFRNSQEAEYMNHMCKKRNIKGVAFKIVPPQNQYNLFELNTPSGRTYFDHSWLEEFYTRRIEDIGKEVAELEIQASGWSEAHEQTRDTALDINKWNSF